MAVKIRLKRMGSKKHPVYRIVVADSRSPRDGRFIETVGTYNPLVQPSEVKLDEELVLSWLNNGAQPSDTVKNLHQMALWQSTTSIQSICYIAESIFGFFFVLLSICFNWHRNSLILRIYQIVSKSLKTRNVK